MHGVDGAPFVIHPLEVGLLLRQLRFELEMLDALPPAKAEPGVVLP
jgi:hypothetical protein